MDGDAGMIQLEQRLFGYPIQVTAHRLDRGVHVLVTGGQQSHVGAISIAEPGQTPETRVFPGHKDQFIAEPWAEALAGTVGERAVVACGIHYDHATSEQIAEILAAADILLTELLDRLKA